VLTEPKEKKSARSEFVRRGFILHIFLIMPKSPQISLSLSLSFPPLCHFCEGAGRDFFNVLFSPQAKPEHYQKEKLQSPRHTPLQNPQGYLAAIKLGG
jgi:hypothetical protein